MMIINGNDMHLQELLLRKADRDNEQNFGGKVSKQ